MADRPLQVSDRGRVRLIELADPDTRNSLSPEMLSGIREELERADADPAVGAIVLSGQEKTFASGADIRVLAEASGAEIYLGERRRQWDAIRQVRTPTVAAVSGACLGGGLELALSCDLVLCSERSKFGLPETTLGLIPGAGGTQLVARSAGLSLAMDMILSGRLLSGAEAVAAGLASRAFPEQSWLEDSLAVAAEVAARPPLAQLLAKESVRRSLDVPLEAGIEAERRAFAIALDSEDAREGLAAFLEKRQPAWRQP
ncbi:MAG: enoyl-CoA hydratase/isomerase family protein [Solirubrobacterales bacterium]